MKTLKIAGELMGEDQASLKAGKRAEGQLTLKSRGVVRVGATRGGGAEPAKLKVDETDVAAMEFEGGFKLWIRADDLQREFGVKTARGAGDVDASVWEINPEIRRDTSERGVAGIAVKTLEFFGVDLKAEAAEGLAGWFEKKTIGHAAGLYHCPLPGEFQLKKADGAVAGPDPILLFIHGTASSTAGSFGKLWARDNAEGLAARETLVKKYKDRVYAFDHWSLTQSPIDNALALAKELPDGAELHLVTHSRGGLVGELLCLGQRDRAHDPLTPETLDKLFARDRTQAELLGLEPREPKEYQEQRKQLASLLQVLDKKQFKIKRFMRVACPARGTTLASGRLDRWLSVLQYLGGEGLADDAIDFLLGVVKQRTDPRSLPGLEAMMPGSALVRLLNHVQLRVESDLSVIAGDVEGQSIWGRLKWLVTDWFYKSDHDLVVNTGSMYGGTRRKDGACFAFDHGPDVNHFNYFAKSSRMIVPLVAGLTREGGIPAGFRPIEEARHEEPAWRSALARAPQGPRPVAFVLPGILGSHLQAGKDRVWLDYLDLAVGDVERLDINAKAVSPEEPIDDYYGEFMVYLSRTHEVAPFAYDWRLSILKNAEALAKAIEEKLPACEKARQPLRLVAHSMGGLVARAMIALRPRVWDRMKAIEGCRLLMLGVPNAGSFETVRWLVAQNETLGQLAFLDFAHDRDEILGFISRFPGLLELLPAGGLRDFSQPGLWADLRAGSRGSWPLPQGKDLLAIRKTWETLRNSPVDPDRMIYIAGWARRTAIDYEVRKGAIRFSATRKGDGTVPWELGRLPGVKTWYVEEAEHDQLLDHEPVFPAYLELLQKGATTRLPTTEPAVSRAAMADERDEMPTELPDSQPAEGDLSGFTFGPGRPRKGAKKRRLPRVEITIRHGDLAYARHPVCVGHYQGDTIVSAEASLDRTLEGALTKRARLGLYPGALGTHEVVIHRDPHAKPGGAIVIGLGQVGELSPGSLESGIARALLDYALQVADWPGDDRFGGSPRSARISCLFIGTGFGAMTVRDSIESILRGVRLANLRLVDARFDDKVLIDTVEFLELYQDVAILGARALGNILLDGDLEAHFSWREREVVGGDGGRQRVLFEEAANWWHRLEIIHDPKRDELRFIALTDRARAEETLVAGQMGLADNFIREAITTTGNAQEVSRTLFEMLIPNRLKELAPNQYDVVLLVDEVSGRYPWELLEDKWAGVQKPLAVAAGMLRQLKTQAFRPRPAHTFEKTAYVVGNPVIPPTKEGAQFPDLPGAEAEAAAVEKLLGDGGYRVTTQIRTQARNILMGLHGDGYRILHLAGHGIHDFEIEVSDGADVPCATCQQPAPKRKKRVSGMVIGQDVYLTPGDVEQMRWVPELVFINCCYLGSTTSTDPAQNRYNALAANIAMQFIRMGVKAVVAAGWAVDDGAAKDFASSFYQHMLRGDAFGQAVRAAREEIYLRHPQANTWGAYQCYGDPDFHLDTHKDGGGKGSRPNYVYPAELVTALDNLAASARMGEQTMDDLQPILDRIPEGLREKWQGRADVAAALGIAYGEVGEFRQGITWLDKAVECNKAEFPLNAVEQRANFKARWAVDLAHAGKKADGGRKPQTLIQEAIEELKSLLTMARTTERLSLLGSAHKRKAWIGSGNERKQAIKEMETCYREAHDSIYGKGNGKLDTYPLLSWLTAVILRNWPQKPDARTCAEVEKWCQMAETAAAEREQTNPDFWNTAVKPDCDLVRAMARQTLKEQQETIVEGYRRAKQRGASQRQFRSVLEHLEFLAEIAGGARQQREQFGALKAIKEQLSAMGG
jgi:tetratricopeptide (TPR) repeat protein/pimeloyl-ACP methyl ester carboxylesterase